jgi:hypothetical protein
MSSRVALLQTGFLLLRGIFSLSIINRKMKSGITGKGAIISIMGISDTHQRKRWGDG